jgi:hypothetical protein
MDQQAAQELANIQQQITQPGASKLSISKQTGTFQHPSGGDLGAEIRGVIVDFISVNRWYPHAFRPDNPLPPGCFAFGKVIKDMAPDEAAPEPQGDLCATCPKNQWESDRSGGRGKDCKNSREFGFILEDQLDEEEPEILVFSVPPTSLKNFDGYVSQLARTYGKLPVQVTTLLTAVPKENYHLVSFTPGDENPNVATHWGLREQVVETLTRLPNLDNYVASDARPTPRKAAPAAPKAAARR